jgi:hypothetical protein
MIIPTRDSNLAVTHIDYRGVSGKIIHPHDNYKWAFYIYVNLKQIKDEEIAKSLWIEAGEQGFCSYMSNDLIGSLAFHGGCTFYNKAYGRWDQKIIEIGCDYGHYGDEIYDYSLESVKFDLLRCIDSLHEATTYLIFEQSKGELIEEKDVFYREGGVYPKAYAIEKGWLKEEVANAT